MAWLRSLGLSLCLVLVSIGYVPTRAELGGEALCGDAIAYAAMVSGSDSAPGPFRYRVLVPLLARALPLAPAWSLAVVSWLSLLVTYALLLESARLLHIARAAAVLGVAAAALTAPHLYNYYNPYITDATGLLVITTCLYALLARRHWLFVLASTLGMSVREPLVFVSAAWSATSQWRRAAVSIALPLTVYATLHFLIGPSRGKDEGPLASFPARSPREIVSDALGAWHAFWLTAPVGLAMLGRHRRELVGLSTLLLGGALVTSLLASDTVRMFQPLFPPMALGMAAYVQALWSRSRGTTVLLFAVCMGSSWVWQPVRFVTLQRGSEAYLVAHVIAFSALFLVAAISGLILWKSRRPDPANVNAEDSFVELTHEEHG